MADVKKLCKLPNGRTVYVGSSVLNTSTKKEKFAVRIRNEDGDKYLVFDDGTEALAVAGSDFWKTYSGGAHIHLK